MTINGICRKLLALLFVITLYGCSPRTTIEPTNTQSAIVSTNTATVTATNPLPTSTTTPLPTKTNQPTTIPTNPPPQPVLLVEENIKDIQVIGTSSFFPLGMLKDAEWSPDGKTLIVSTNQGLQILDSKTLIVLHQIQGYEFVLFLQNGNLLLRDQQGLPAIYNKQSAEVNLIDAEFPHNDWGYDVRTFAISPDGNVIADVSVENKVILTNIKTGEISEFVYYLNDYGKLSPQGVVFSPDQKFLYVSNHIVSDIYELLVFDVEKQYLFSQQRGIYGIPTFTPDEKRLIFATFDYVSLYTTTMAPWSNHSNWFRASLNEEEQVDYRGKSYAFIQDSSKIAILYQGDVTNTVKKEQRFIATIIIYDTSKGNDERFINNLPATSFDVGFSPDGSQFFTLSEDGYIQIWQTSDGKLLLTSQRYNPTVSHYDPSADIAVSPNGELLAYPIFGGVQIVNRSDGKIISEFSPYPITRKTYVAFQGNDTIAISFSSYNYSQTDTYNIATGEMVRRYPQLTNCTFNHTGITMICAQNDFKLFDAKMGRTLLQIKPNDYEYDYAVSDDGAYTAYCNANSETVFLWDTKTGQQLRYLKKNNQPACGYLDFSADGQFLVSSMGAVWQIPQGVLVVEIPVQSIENNFWIRPLVDIATNNEFVLIYPNIYSLKSGNLLAEINSNGEWIRDAWFLADGFQLVLRGEDTLQFWGVQK